MARQLGHSDPSTSPQKIEAPVVRVAPVEHIGVDYAERRDGAMFHAACVGVNDLPLESVFSRERLYYFVALLRNGFVVTRPAYVHLHIGADKRHESRHVLRNTLRSMQYDGIPNIRYGGFIDMMAAQEFL